MVSPVRLSGNKDGQEAVAGASKARWWKRADTGQFSAAAVQNNLYPSKISYFDGNYLFSTVFDRHN
jgi:hypothetical protein